MELLAGDRLGKYEIVGRLAAGGMAEVYLARSLGHAGFSKAVALKRMLPDLAREPGFREMFMGEASVAARLNHANIVQIFDFAEDRGELYLAMEFVHGATLRKLLYDAHHHASGRLEMPPMLAAQIARAVAKALQFAWTVPDESGAPSHLIHRDISPHNILLSYDGDAKLADFGIARSADRMTSVGMLKGKLLYMSPEQMKAGVLDARSDLFALGIVLYEAATNLSHALFDAADQKSVMQAVNGKYIAPPERVNPDVPPGLSAVIMKALEREPEKRFQSGAEFADALGEVLHKEAKGPQDYDLAAFMRRVYGETPALPAPRPASSPALAASSRPPDVAAAPAAPPAPGDDRYAPTLSREAAAQLTGNTTVDRKRPASAAPEEKETRRLPPVPVRPLQGFKPIVKQPKRSPGATLAIAGLSVAVLASVGFVVTRGGKGSVAPGEPANPGPVAAAAPAGAAHADPVAAVPPSVAHTEPKAPEPAPVATAAAPAGLVVEPPRGVEPENPKPAPVVAPPRPVVRGYGSLQVIIQPWGYVSVDGSKPAEAAPLFKVPKLLAGEHTLQVGDGETQSRTIKFLVKPNATAEITGSLTTFKQIK